MSDEHDQHNDYSCTPHLLSQYSPKQKQRGRGGWCLFHNLVIGRGAYLRVGAYSRIYCKAFFAQYFSNVVTAELMWKCTCKCSKVLGGGLTLEGYLIQGCSRAPSNLLVLTIDF